MTDLEAEAWSNLVSKGANILASLKRHEGHPASCLCCVHFNTSFESDWSDITPGAGLGYYCYNQDSSWYQIGDLEDRQELHDKLMVAQECEQFQGRRPKPLVMVECPNCLTKVEVGAVCSGCGYGAQPWTLEDLKEHWAKLRYKMPRLEPYEFVD